MTTPTKYDLMVQAKKELAEINAKLGIPPITPTEKELKESGAFKRAKHTLMSTRQRYESEQRKYVEEVADELKLKVVPKREYGRRLKYAEAFEQFKQQHPAYVKKVNGYRIVLPAKPKPQPKKRRVKLPKAIAKPTLPKVVLKKPRRKRRVERVGKTMRALRKVNGVKVFSFPDDVWKIRKPRRRKR